MTYTKAEEAILQLAAVATPNNLRRQTSVSLARTIAVWIGAALMLIKDHSSTQAVAGPLLIAGSIGMAFGYVQFRNRALLLIQKLQSRPLAIEDSSAQSVVQF